MSDEARGGVQETSLIVFCVGLLATLLSGAYGIGAGEYRPVAVAAIVTALAGITHVAHSKW